jgi:hypothetical protein
MHKYLLICFSDLIFSNKTLCTNSLFILKNGSSFRDSWRFFMRLPIINQIVEIFNWSVQYAAMYIITRILLVEYCLKEECSGEEGESEGQLLKKHPLHDSKLAELSGAGE